MEGRRVCCRRRNRAACGISMRSAGYGFSDRDLTEGRVDLQRRQCVPRRKGNAGPPGDCAVGNSPRSSVRGRTIVRMSPTRCGRSRGRGAAPGADRLGRRSTVLALRRQRIPAPSPCTDGAPQRPPAPWSVARSLRLVRGDHASIYDAVAGALASQTPVPAEGDHKHAPDLIGPARTFFLGLPRPRLNALDLTVALRGLHRDQTLRCLDRRPRPR